MIVVILGDCGSREGEGGKLVFSGAFGFGAALGLYKGEQLNGSAGIYVLAWRFGGWGV